MNKTKNLFFLFILTSVLLIPAGCFAQELVINLVAVNATPLEKKEKDIKYYVPKELAPEDLLDTGGLTLDYDVDKKAYFLHGKFMFKPQETKTFKVKVRDVWKIPVKEIGILKRQLDDNVASLKEHESYPYAMRVRDRLMVELDHISSLQDSYSDNIERRIEEYRAYVKELEDMRKEIYNVHFLQYQSKALDEINNMDKTIKFIVEVKNPSNTKNKTVKHKYYMPQEIRAEDIVDKQGFDVRFDEDKGRSYVTKEEEFKPGEVKKYEFVLKDIWQFPSTKIDSLQERAKASVDELEGSIFEESGKFLINKIMGNLDKIRALLDMPQDSIKKHIGMYRINIKRYEEASEDFKKVEEMLAIVRAKKLEDLQKGKVRNILSRLRALRGLSALSEALFKKGISVTMTWRIIMGTILFVAFFSALHFLIWARRSKVVGEEMGLKPGENIKMVPKPGEGPAQEEEES